MILPSSTVQEKEELSGRTYIPPKLFENLPELEKIYNDFGHLSLGKYLNVLLEKIKPIKNNVPIIQQAILDEAGRLLGNQINLEDFEKQLTQYPVLSTADHHGFLHYGLLLNTNILYLHLFHNSKQHFCPVLSTGTIPVSNCTLPGGFQYKSEKYRFISMNKYRHYAICQLKHGIIQGKQLSKTIVNLENSEHAYVLDDQEKKFLEYLLFDILKTNDFTLKDMCYADQVTIINHRLWKYFFDKAERDTLPNLVYLQFNAILNTVILTELPNKESLIAQLLFDKKTRDIYTEAFQNIPGCWGEKGTFLFWEVRRDNKGLGSLKYDRDLNLLVGTEGTYVLQPEIISEALSMQKIFPGIFWNFFILTFLGGYFTPGGFNQIGYLSQMRKAHVSCLRKLGKADVADLFASRITDGFICGMQFLPWGSSIDMLWEHNSSNGLFNGNLDQGLTREYLAERLDQRVSTLIENTFDQLKNLVNT